MQIYASCAKSAMLRTYYRANPIIEAKLSSIRAAQDLAAILPLSSDPSSRVRRETSKKMMAWVEQEQAAATLKTMLQDPDGQVRWFSALSLGASDPHKYIAELGRLLRTQKSENWMLASIMQMQRIVSGIVPLIKTGLQGPEAIKNLAVHMLGRFGDLNLIKEFEEDAALSIRETSFSFLYPKAQVNVELSSPTSFDIHRAVLFGEAIGDAMGAPVEFSSLEEIRRIGYVDGFLKDPVRPLFPGDYTDDTQMALMVAKSIIRTGKIDPNDMAGIFAAFGLKLDMGLTRNVGYSNSTLTSYRRLYAGLNWRLAANQSDGCGPATAVVPLGLIIDDLALLRKSVGAVTLITKTGKEALGGALAIAYLINQGRLSRLPDSVEGIVERTAQYIENESPKMAFEIRRLPSLMQVSTEDGLNQIPSNIDGKKVKTGMKALGVVPSAIYCFLKSLPDFRRTIIAGVNTQGDSDSIAGLAGAISAAHNGLTVIPNEWIEGLIEHREISAYADQLSRIHLK
ncbi:ADP-ribosylglycohydrolase family protein [Candidatus Saganbacteria bacterium]|nr:ADP-ribosylglycohydrolase family protein [Candidatus Saganbacteria bacterium]